MGTTKSISLDEESETKLEELRQFDNNFNLSEFIRNSLLGLNKEDGEEEILFKIKSKEGEIVLLGQEINKLGATINKIANEVTFLKEKIIRNKLEKEQKEKEVRETIAKIEDKKFRYYEQTKENIRIIWDIQNEEELNKLATEFIEGSFKGCNLSKFMKEKGDLK